MNEKHELIIQRMVDNELDETQRAEFLKLADTQPELWRQAALAFVEDRVWSSVVSSKPIAGESVLDSSARPGKEKVLVTRGQPWWLKYGPPLMITAASVLVVLSLALRFNPVERTPGPAPVADFAQQTEPPTELESLGPQGSQLASQPMRLQVNEKFDVPVYEDREQFRSELQRLSQLKPGLLERFQNAGYDVQPDIQYIRGNSQDGRSFIVPIQRFQIRRMGQ